MMGEKITFNRCYACMEPLNDVEICPVCGYNRSRSNKTTGALPPSTVLSGRYVLGKAMGRCEGGYTYIAWDLANEAKVVVKEFFPNGGTKRAPDSLHVVWSRSEYGRQMVWNYLTRIMDEANRTHAIRQAPEIAGITDAFTANDTVYLVRDHIDGIPLNVYVNRKGAFSGEAFLRSFSGMIEALAKAHECGVTHRRLAPEQIVIKKDGTACIINTGVGFDLVSAKDLSVTLPQQQMAYKAPEQLVTGQEIGPWTDVYAVSASLLFALTGSVPPSPPDLMYSPELGEEIMETIQALQLPVSAKNALRKGIQIRKEQRLQSMREFADLFFGREETKKAEALKADVIPESVPDRETGEDAPKRPVWILGVLAAVLLVALFVIIFCG